MSILNDDIDYEPLYEGFIANLKERYHIEIEQKDIQWRGFGSQGDGLSFDFSIADFEVTKFLEAISAPHQDNFKKFWNVDYIFSCGIETKKNTFATCYCHSQTRNIAFWFENYQPDVSQYCSDIKKIKDDSVKITEHIKAWYVKICDDFYNLIQNHYEESCNEFPDFPDEEVDQNEMTISNRIDSMIDPEMNIYKVIEMIKDAKTVSFTKEGEAEAIDKFATNFDNEYLIIKRG